MQPDLHVNMQGHIDQRGHHDLLDHLLGRGYPQDYYNIVSIGVREIGRDVTQSYEKPLHP